MFAYGRRHAAGITRRFAPLRLTPPLFPAAVKIKKENTNRNNNNRNT